MVKKKRQSEQHDDGSSTDSSEEKALGSPNSAISGCQHVKKSLDTTKLRKLLKSNGLSQDCALCTKPSSTTEEKSATTDDPYGFEYDNTLWLCLKCGTQLCGRSKNQHALQHFKTPHSDSHALTMNTRSYEIWCYECDNEVNANSRKNLAECVELVKKIQQKPPSAALSPTPISVVATTTVTAAPINNIEHKILATFETMRPLLSNEDVGNKAQLSPPAPPPPPIPGMAKRVSAITSPMTLPLPLPLQSSTINSALSSNNTKVVDPFSVESLPRVRGLTNLGNTCFFNAVMQCLAQTPYLLDVLNESSESGEEFTLPGGTFQFKDEEDVELPMIKGTLAPWGPLTAALAQALEELQSGGGVFTPSKLFDKLCGKCPQFRGGDQHDSHELLRHLLESVRSEDLKRYQRVILKNLGYKDQDQVSEEMRQKCKIYGNQAADRILRPEQVFRGFLVSTLTCQDCYNVSSRHEYFLDMSLPVSVEKPQPPQRRKSSPENAPTSFFLNTEPVGPSKAQIKKEKEKERKAKRAQKHHAKKIKQQIVLGDSATGSVEDSSSSTPPVLGCATRDEAYACSSSGSSSEQSDADVEDNLIDDVATTSSNAARPSTIDPNGNNQLPSPITNPEKRDDSPENMDKDSLDEDEDENDSGIATSPANAGSFLPSSETNGGATSDAASTTTNNSVLTVGLSEKGANLMRQLSLGDKAMPIKGEQLNDQAASKKLTNQLENLKLSEEQTAQERKKKKRVRTQSYSDWSTTIAPRYQCEDGECSVQSCLNNFTAVELMTGNNKVGCDNCTKRINGDDPKAKTVNTNATKQFLISSPPAVLILHLKRFQLGPRCIFRKLTRPVSFQMVLDIAPFCGSKVKNLPNIDRKQKKLLYALYGVVEHSGGMCGGHYTAYVKVRAKLPAGDKRWKFIPQGSKAELDQADEQREKLEELLAKEKARELRLKAADDSDDFSTSSNSSTSDPDEQTTAADVEGAVGGDEEAKNVQVPLGKWYYVSDSRVQEVNEDSVLKAQAYLLFYERIY